MRRDKLVSLALRSVWAGGEALGAGRPADAARSLLEAQRAVRELLLEIPQAIRDEVTVDMLGERPGASARPLPSGPSPCERDDTRPRRPAYTQRGRADPSGNSPLARPEPFWD